MNTEIKELAQVGLNDIDFLDNEAPDQIQPIPILRTFAQNATVKVLSGLAELSFVAGREGDDEDDWDAEANEALIDAFKFERTSNASWYDTAKAALQRAFESGVAQRVINMTAGDPPARALAVARARAIIYADEMDAPEDALPCHIDRAIGRVARLVAERHPVTDAEAVYVAMHAFHDAGFKSTMEVAAFAMKCAANGRKEREACERRAARRAAMERAAVEALFGASA